MTLDELLVTYCAPHDEGTQTSRYQTIPQDGWESRVERSFERLIKQARDQIKKLRPYTPEIGLLWSFASPDSLALFNTMGGEELVGEWRYTAMHIPPSRVY